MYSDSDKKVYKFSADLIRWFPTIVESVFALCGVPNLFFWSVVTYSYKPEGGFVVSLCLV